MQNYRNDYSQELASPKAQGKGRVLVPITLAFIGLLAALFVLWATPSGAMLSTDSISYLDGARSLMKGEGYSFRIYGDSKPLTAWPPLYSFLIMLVARVGIDVYTAARWLNALLAASNVWLVGFLAYRFTNRSPVPALLSALVMAVSADILTIHMFVWSEPAFTFLTLLGFGFLTRYLTKPGWMWLMFSAVLFSLACLTKYTGGAFVLGGAVCIMAFARIPIRRRLLALALFVVVSSIPIALFVFRNLLVAERMHPVNPSFHLISLSFLWQGVNVALSCFLPGMYSWFLLKVSLALAFSILFLAFAWHTWKYGELRTRFSHLLPVGITLILAAIHLAFHVLFATLFGTIQLQTRYFAPLHSLLIIAVAVFFYSMVQAAGKKRVIRLLVAAFCIMLIIKNCRTSVGRAANIRSNGLYFTALSWVNSETMSWLKRLKLDGPIYSNYYDVIYWYTGRSALQLPNRFDENKKQLRTEYTAEMATMFQVLKSKNGIIVYFHNRLREKLFPSLSELQNEAPLQLLKKFDDALVLYFLAHSGEVDNTNRAELIE